MMRSTEPDIRPPRYQMGGQTFAIPAFYPKTHRETFLVIKLIKNSDWSLLKSRMRSNPELYRNSYYQLIDVPPSEQPLFHNRAVMYLTIAGIAAYFGSANLLRQLVNSTEPQVRECNIDVNDPCFVTNVRDKITTITDVHAIFPACIAIRRSQWDVLPALLDGGWIPHESFKLPYRKFGCAFYLTYADAFDYFLGQMVHRPNLDLSKFFRTLIQSFHENFVLRTCLLQEKWIEGNLHMQDLLSLPRRLLRFMYEQDVNFRMGAGIIHAIQVFVDHHFFNGPTRVASEISLEHRLQIYRSGFLPDNYYTRTVYDQDCCIALMLGYITRTEVKNFVEIHKKAVNVMLRILTETRWLLRFINVPLVPLSNYFLSIGEKVDIPVKTIMIIRAAIPTIVKRDGYLDLSHLDPDIIDLKQDHYQQIKEMVANAQAFDDDMSIQDTLQQLHCLNSEPTTQYDFSASNSIVQESNRHNSKVAGDDVDAKSQQPLNHNRSASSGFGWNAKNSSRCIYSSKSNFEQSNLCRDLSSATKSRPPRPIRLRSQSTICSTGLRS